MVLVCVQWHIHIVPQLPVQPCHKLTAVQARDLLVRAADALHSVHARFWLSSGTLLGWFRQVGHVSFNRSLIDWPCVFQAFSASLAILSFSLPLATCPKFHSLSDRLAPCGFVLNNVYMLCGHAICVSKGMKCDFSHSAVGL